jgi:beta-lactamase superfamily II metal-dependent hydrolase
VKHCFVELPQDYKPVQLIDSAGKNFRQVLWGDWLRIKEGADAPNSKWLTVLWAWNDPDKKKELRIERRFTTEKRPLEIIFVDVGQGDGAVLITPERDQKERILVIDAGEGDHMCDFLDQRFKAYRKGFKFHAAIITHPDKDHYYGFRKIFDSGTIQFSHCYHSGLVERPDKFGWAGLGGHTKDPVTKISYLGGLIETDQAMRDTFSVDGPASDRLFTKTIRAALEKNAVGSFQMLSTGHGTSKNGKSWVPQFAPSSTRDYEIEVVGPFLEKDASGNNVLRKISGEGKTKNGHSVLLKLTYNNFSVLFGGDLNKPAEKFLLQQYSGMSHWPRNATERTTMIKKCRAVFRSDVMKVCHHGASDVTDEFLETVNPAAFVISSGDEEGHVHPRPDLLGRLGRVGRGHSPVLLSTELQRSTRDKEDSDLVARMKRIVKGLSAAPTASELKTLEDGLDALARSNVSVDGAIYLKTDGKRLITAFKKESNSATKKWFYFEYRVKEGELQLVPRKGH